MEFSIKVKNINKSFIVGKQKVQVLKDINLEVKDNDFVVVFGPSGSGKSTLLHTILGLEKPDTGTVNILGTEIYSELDEDGRSEFRKKYIGMVYQQPNWVRSLSVVENVAFPMLLTGATRQNALWQANKTLERLDMAAWASYKPSELSSGQQQRVALARAIINNPKLIITDEPTGNLDNDSGRNLMNLLSDLNTKFEKTIIMVTHDLEYLSYAKSAIKMFDGTAEAVYKNKDKILKKEIAALKEKLNEALN